MATTEPAPRPPVVTGIADPGPLGLAAFALTTFVLSVHNSHLVATVEPTVFGLALFYGGIVQVLAGMWEFVKGNTFGATAFASYGAFWMSLWYLLTHVATDFKAAVGLDLAHGVGVWLMAWAIFTTYMLIASTRTSGILILVFVVLAATFWFLAIGWLSLSKGEVANTNGWIKVGGWLGIVTAALAWYASFAGVTNATYKRVVLPTFPR